MEHIKKMKVTPEVCTAIRTAYDLNESRSATRKIAEAFNLSSSTISCIKRSAFDFNAYLSAASPTFKKLGAVNTLPTKFPEPAVHEDHEWWESDVVINVICFLIGIVGTLMILNLTGALK